jgi:hypothetical protein
MTCIKISFRWKNAYQYYWPKYKNDGCNCNETIIYDCGDYKTGYLDRGAAAEATVNIICKEHFGDRYYLNISLIGIDGTPANYANDVVYIKLTQTITESNKTNIEEEHYSNWKNVVSKRAEEIKNLIDDRNKILIKLDSYEQNEDAVIIEKNNRTEMIKDIEYIAEQIYNHNKEISEIKKSNSKLTYEEKIYTNSIEIMRGENVDFDIYPLQYDNSKKNDIQNFTVSWDFYCGENLSHRTCSTKRKEISQEIHTLTLPKLQKSTASNNN